MALDWYSGGWTDRLPFNARLQRAADAAPDAYQKGRGEVTPWAVVRQHVYAFWEQQLQGRPVVLVGAWLGLGLGFRVRVNPNPNPTPHPNPHPNPNPNPKPNPSPTNPSPTPTPNRNPSPNPYPNPDPNPPTPTPNPSQDPVANDVKYQGAAQPFLVFGILTTALAIGHHTF